MSDRIQCPVVIVTKCAECIYECSSVYIHDDGSKSGPHDYCPQTGQDIPDETTIPDWCPLPKVADLKKELGL